MKKENLIAIILLILSACGIFVFVIFPVISGIIAAVSVSSSASVGIIGGADGPTVFLVLFSLYGNIFYFVGAIISVTVFVLSVIYLIKNKRKN